MAIPNYTEANIRSLAWQEHLRLRPGMYIGKLGDGSLPDDGIYILIKEVIDNSVDEFVIGYGKKIEIKIAPDNQVSIRDFGRGIPLGKLVDCVAKINTGGKYDSQAFQKSVGLNGVGIKAVNALSAYCKVQSFRDGLTKSTTFSAGVLLEESEILATDEPNGTHVTFKPDGTIFKEFAFIPEYIAEQIAHYTFLNTGLIFNLNGKKYHSKGGLLDLLQAKTAIESHAYPIIHLKKQDIELALTHHHTLSSEAYYTFVNGQFTPQGGSHLNGLKEAIVQTIRGFYKKEFDATDIRAGLIAALSIKVQEPIFESQTKTKLGSQQMSPEGPTIRSFIIAFIKSELDNYLHKNPAIAEIVQKRILQSEHERKETAGIKKLVHEKTKKANLHNKKLRDCHVHFNAKHPNRADSTIFITEGNSASGSITKSRNVETQAVFSLRGKPLNCFGQSKKLVYENEEFNLLQHALNIANGPDGLRYNKIVIATDADVDGMHIRLLILTYFLQFFPELVYSGHLYILETPLFRVRNRKTTHYCYNEQEKEAAIQSLGAQPEITRFKGLGEISPDEFAHFIGAAIRLVPVTPATHSTLEALLTFYMGKNTPERRNFIINNLKIENNLPSI
ncbi:MAG: type IIA DNA topoisomerase subunit B [Candidatus Cardinium sp.]|uniref:DNA topoisomerase IV subunit B n=1 Tax=Cardinium endosymbiont of Dermatophagoides farinae TaxID=2597823 RepID=UPI001183F963|nr:DNA topoisomerase IV subunit B [Cardinium endosymbiont of Dermatophagoides farinae]TSJ81504.1 type IIA DNA topoisomerase subunit B [Cardinium endosymbiont of Dermatophagoides farinae]UWW97507.1 MAG: type IIA DNA topoisomerase subunit B [Candidatus Cardinium sp.]